MVILVNSTQFSSIQLTISWPCQFQMISVYRRNRSRHTTTNMRPSPCPIGQTHVSIIYIMYMETIHIHQILIVKQDIWLHTCIWLYEHIIYLYKTWQLNIRDFSCKREICSTCSNVMLNSTVTPCLIVPLMSTGGTHGVTFISLMSQLIIGVATKFNISTSSNIVSLPHIK